MSALKEDHERAVGDKFVEWYNERYTTGFRFSCRPNEAPDLEYTDGSHTLLIEVADGYYDESDAKLKWKSAKRQVDAPTEWTGMNFHGSLIANIGNAIRSKCKKRYGQRCFLLVNVSLSLTTSCEMKRMIERIELPPRSGIPFECIYLSGSFGTSGNEENERPYEVWMLSSNAG